LDAAECCGSAGSEPKTCSSFFEAKRRDPALASLYALLKEPDDFVRITVARQLLSKKNDAAINVLDAITQQHSEFSGFAQRMAAQWRKGELEAWS